MIWRTPEKELRRVTIMLSWISHEFLGLYQPRNHQLLQVGGRQRGYPMSGLVTGFACSQQAAQSANLSSTSILYHVISSFSNISAPAH